jgi:hypothetical protein
MSKYRKKPVTIEAFQMTKARRLDNSEWPAWLHQAWQLSTTELGSVFCSPDGELVGEPSRLFIQTLEGTMKVEWGDWIIQGIKGELYPCKPDIFELTYDPA